MINEKNNMRYLWISAIVGLALFAVILTGTLIAAGMRKSQADERLEAFYRHELYELADSTFNLETAAAKVIVSRTAPKEYLADLDRHAYAAAQSVSKLPFEEVSATRALAFYNRVSDYAKSDVAGYEEAAENIYVTAKRLGAAIADVLDEVDAGLRLSDNIVSLGIEYEKGEGDEQISENSIDYPELIYDGPFSDGRKPQCYKALEELEEMTPEAAVEKFTQLFGASDAQIVGESGYPETYEITGKLNDMPIYASLSKRGGMVINLSVNKTVQSVDLGEKDVKNLAVRYAEKLGYTNMIPVWYNDNAGVAYVNLAPEVDDVLYYTDLVKVKIAMDDGAVLGLEATGYCKNHNDRTYNAVMGADTAESLVSDKLRIVSTRLCVIPVGEKEAFCYEVAGEYKGLDYFVYLDAVKGEQVNVLRVIDNDQGKLTI